MGGLLAILLTIAAFVIIKWRKNTSAKRAEREKIRQQACEDAERRRLLEQLPPLRTDLFIEMPPEAVYDYYGGHDIPYASWCSSRGFVIVRDREGTMWMGIMSEEIRKALKTSGYELTAYPVPSAGPFWLTECAADPDDVKKWSRLMYMYDGSDHYTCEDVVLA